MLPRELIVVILLAIVASLGWAGYYLIRDRGGEGGKNRTVWALTVRIGLSVALFAFLMLGAWLGWFEPPPPPDFTR